MDMAVDMDKPSWEEVTRISRGVLGVMAVWTHTDEDVRELFPDPKLSSVSITKIKEKLNRDVVLVVMLLLTLSPTPFSLRRLADSIDHPRSESLQKSLNDWILPLLEGCGWIDGYAKEKTYHSQAHRITISDKGKDHVRDYATRVKEIKCE